MYITSPSRAGRLFLPGEINKIIHENKEITEFRFGSCTVVTLQHFYDQKVIVVMHKQVLKLTIINALSFTLIVFYIKNIRPIT